LSTSAFFRSLSASLHAAAFLLCHITSHLREYRKVH
jgi:hypothetical protein